METSGDEGSRLRTCAAVAGSSRVWNDPRRRSDAIRASFAFARRPVDRRRARNRFRVLPAEA